MSRKRRSKKSSHPGHILLKHFLEPLGLSRDQFVEKLGGSWDSNKINEIIDEKQGVTVDIAIDLAKALGTPADFWLHLQISHDSRLPVSSFS